ncbi:PAS domain S-box protein [Candidatus Magnetomonas plexicatena]|uniref:PAS domain S-box protein n=1 Tax=Candidatus Magnetomonas plexicatena TaxID=2552947 RepID=UPI001102A6AB|nr:PAS domain S-box protein [Nitrospirales bacterium LBB_01]
MTNKNFSSDLQILLDTIPIGVIYIDNKMKVMKVNSFIEKLTGKTNLELTGRPCYEVIAEKVDGQSSDKKPEVCSFCRVQHCLATKTPAVVERSFGEKHIKVTLIPQFDSDGEVSQYLEVIEDITSQLETEQKIVSNSQMQSVVDLILQISLEPIDLKEQLERILDFIFTIPKLALESKGCVFLADEENKRLKIKAQRGLPEPILSTCNELPYNKCICGRVAQSRESIYAPDIDEHHDISYESMPAHGHYCVPIISGQKLLGVLNLYIGRNHKRDTDEEEFLATVANTIANVIERKKAEEVLRDQKEFLRSIVQSTQDAIITINSEGIVLFWNDGAGRTFGYSTDEVVGIPLDFIIPERFRHRHYEGIKRVVSTGESEFIGKTFELEALNRQGFEFPVELSLAMWKDQKEPFFTGIIRDISRRKNAQTELQHSVEKLRKVIGGIIQTIAMTVEVRDPYTAGHQRRVANLARAIATEMKLDEDMIDAIRMAGTIHDIGKIYVPAEILSKPGKLSDIEFSLIKMHSEVGFDILKTIDFPWPVARIVLEHHEKWDGSGYPLGLKGTDILLEARIICVSDVIEAISFHRPYRAGLGIGKAIEEIQKGRGTLFDPDVVDAASALLTEERFKFD